VILFPSSHSVRDISRVVPQNEHQGRRGPKAKGKDRRTGRDEVEEQNEVKDDVMVAYDCRFKIF